MNISMEDIEERIKREEQNKQDDNRRTVGYYQDSAIKLGTEIIQNLDTLMQLHLECKELEKLGGTDDLILFRQQRIEDIKAIMSKYLEKMK